MYLINWIDDHRVINVSVGNRDSVFAVANLLDNRKIKFTVTGSAGLVFADGFGFGPYEYWSDNLQ